MEEIRQISFKELVEIRTEEMQHMLPGLMTEVTNGEKTVRVYSPDPLEKSKFRVKAKE